MLKIINIGSMENKEKKAVFVKQGVSFEKKPFNKGGFKFKGKNERENLSKNKKDE